jgi:transposase
VAARADLTDARWAVLEPLPPKGKKPGRPPKWTKLELIDGIRRRTRVGSPWRDVPSQYGPWQTVYGLYRRWQRDGTWARILTGLPEDHAVSALERLRQSPRRNSGPMTVKALQRAEQIASPGVGRVEVREVPANPAERAGRTGLGSKASGAGADGRAEADGEAAGGGAVSGRGRGG